MSTNFIYIITWVFFPIAILSLLLGYRYFKHKENMFMIETNKDSNFKHDINKNSLIIWASVFLGVGIGLLIGIIIIQAKQIEMGLISICVLVSSIFVCMGFALLLCYLVIKKSL